MKGYLRGKDRQLVVWLVMVMAVLWAWPLMAQEAVAAVAAGESATGAAPADVFSTQLVVSYVLVWFGEVLKRMKAMPWLQEGAPIANRVMASLFAAAQTVGIGATFDTASGTLAVTGLSLALIVPLAVEFGRAYVTQKLLWLMAFKRPE